MVVASGFVTDTNRALGMFTLTIGMGPIIGPTFAGAIIAFFSWHWIFFINIPICLLAFIGTLLRFILFEIKLTLLSRAI